MDARVLHIVDKVAPVDYFPAVPQNFVLRDGEDVPAEAVLAPDVSLYCLDDDNRQALFVETSPGVDLAAAPFYYLEQYEQARRLLAVPYETLHRLADGAGDADLILVYSVGRCGSTLVSRALNAVDGVRSYSEPDVYTNLAMLRHLNPGREEEYVRLIASCTRILGRGAPTLAVKTRGSGIYLGDLFHRAFPTARNVFLYRQAERWLESMNAGFTKNLPGPEAEPMFTNFLLAQAPLLMPFITRHERDVTLTEAYALSWLSIVDGYLALREKGVPMLALRYEEIKAEPKPTLLALLTWCGLPVEDFDAVHDTFATDSQEGTMLSRASRERNPAPALSPEDYAQTRAVIAEHPVVRTPDFDASAPPDA